MGKDIHERITTIEEAENTREILKGASLIAFFLSSLATAENMHLFPGLLSVMGVILNMSDLAYLEFVIRRNEDNLFNALSADDIDKLAVLKKKHGKRAEEYIQFVFFLSLAAAVYGSGLAWDPADANLAPEIISGLAVSAAVLAYTWTGKRIEKLSIKHEVKEKPEYFVEI